ncbi:hypothetical protein WA158_008046 [Blastocystis sp. Blastoise]
MAEQTTYCSLSIDSVQPMLRVLNTMSKGDKNEQLSCEFSNSGLFFTVIDRSKTLQVNAHFAKEKFLEFIFEGQSDSITVSYMEFIQCLSIYGNEKSANTKLTLIYSSSEGLVQLKLDESGITSLCNIKTMMGTNIDIDFPSIFNSTTANNKCILESSTLDCGVSDIYRIKDGKSIGIQFTENGLNILSDDSLFAKCTIFFKSDNSGIISYSSENDHIYRYNREFFLRCMNTLSISLRSYIRINQEGMMCIQHMIGDDTNNLYTDFFLLPLQDINM